MVDGYLVPAPHWNSFFYVKIHPETLWTLLKSAFEKWSKDNVTRLGAALAYYTVFSIAPLLLIVISVAGLIYGDEAARGEVVKQASSLIGVEAAKLIQLILQNSRAASSGIVSSLIGFVALILGATGVFTELKAALDTVWDVPPKETSIRDLLKDRFMSFLMVVGIGFLLLVSLILTAVISIVTQYFSYILGPLQFLLNSVNLFVSFVVETLLFALMYKILPDVRLLWRDVWFGAAITALFFELGKSLISIYLTHYATSSSFGAAGSLIIVLVWVYYSSQIVLFGAEVTHEHAIKRNAKIAID